jgi:DNA modification methylase
VAKPMNNLSGKEWLQLSFSVWRDLFKTAAEKADKHPASFPVALVERILKIYLKEPNSLVFDPFMGTGTTLVAARQQGHSGVGIDLNGDYCRIAKRRISDTESLWDSQEISSKVIKADSRKLRKYVDESSVDIVVTSPPYWDILNQKRTVDKRDISGYSSDAKDLGNVNDYEAFLEDLRSVFTEVYTVLKPNSRCISVVMDIRKKDRFYPLHQDQSRIMKEIGFELEEYVIWDRQRDYNNMKTLGFPWVFRFNRVHEFICVYWKR